MKCVAAILARNEADRFLTECLQSLAPHCDEILLLDDGSTDATREVASAHGAQVRSREGPPMWGQEAPARAELWAWGAEVAKDGWLLIADADQALVAPHDDWQMMLSSWTANCWGFPLYDCWDAPDQHRSDGHWVGHLTKRAWLFRPRDCPNPEWGTRGVHTGHCPANMPIVGAHAPSSVWWRHYGWMRKADRDEKLARYLCCKDLLAPNELAHLLSVNDE